MVDYQTIETDVLVIGAGGAGLRAAIEAVKNDARVMLVSKEPLGQAHTTKAMGGLNVAIKPPATIKQHFQDTIKGGWYINNQKLVDVFTREMPERIYDLESYGVRFDRLPDGSFYTWAGGKQSAPLNLCAGDYTGWEMMQGLVKEARRLKIPYLANHFVSKLLVSDSRVNGIFLIDMNKGEYKVVWVKAIILALGGAGQMYLINTNEPANTGEGYSLALDVGAELIDMEMVQFHPTGIAFPPKKGKLVTEKVRGHLGILKNKKGERFMVRYQPKLLELAGRDEVSRAIYEEIRAGRGTENDGVYLDVTHWEKGKVEKIIPDVFAEHIEMGIDIRKQMMEISPTMHHMMGGLRINEWGETNVAGLFAVGEVAGGIHGANRLGGNSLAEGQVFGRRVGIRAAYYAKKNPLDDIPEDLIREESGRVESFLKPKDGSRASEMVRRLKTIMWDKVGIIRDEKGLSEALAEIKVLQKKSENLVAERREDLQACMETVEMLKTAEAVVIPALLRKESRGAHYRSDFPRTEKEWQKNIVVYKDNGELKTKIAPVVEI